MVNASFHVTADAVGVISLFGYRSTMHDARIVANAILDRAEEYGRPLTNLDLQKIVYFMHGHYLRKTGKPLVSTEFEAWTYGPVSKIVYDAFKRYEDSPIDGRATAFDPVRRVASDLPSLTDPDALTVLNESLTYYLDMSTYLLVEFTHQPGTPWSAVVESAQDRPNVGIKIPNDLIAERFEGRT